MGDIGCKNPDPAQINAGWKSTQPRQNDTTSESSKRHTLVKATQPTICPTSILLHALRSSCSVRCRRPTTATRRRPLPNNAAPRRWPVDSEPRKTLSTVSTTRYRQQKPTRHTYAIYKPPKAHVEGRQHCCWRRRQTTMTASRAPPPPTLCSRHHTFELHLQLNSYSIRTRLRGTRYASETYIVSSRI